MTEFSDAHMKIVKHCAQECEWQFSGEMSVAWMLGAWRIAQARAGQKLSGGPQFRPILDDVVLLGKTVEPVKNKKGFRLTNVRVGLSVKPDFHEVSRLMEALMDARLDMTPGEFFREYEEIHPFVDGNGRTGNILFNWVNGTLDDPVMPPDFWNQTHREPNRGFYRVPGRF